MVTGSCPRPVCGVDESLEAFPSPSHASGKYIIWPACWSPRFVKKAYESSVQRPLI